MCLGAGTALGVAQADTGSGSDRESAPSSRAGSVHSTRPSGSGVGGRSGSAARSRASARAAAPSAAPAAARLASAVSQRAAGPRMGLIEGAERGFSPPWCGPWWAPRNEVGRRNTAAAAVATTSEPTMTTSFANAVAVQPVGQAVSPLGTPEQTAAEKMAMQTARSCRCWR